MTDKAEWVTEGDLFAVGAALEALRVVGARARSWQVSPCVSRADVESLDEELRALEAGLAVGWRYGLNPNGETRVLWAQLLVWCSKPYVSREELRLVTREVARQQALLLQVQAHLQTGRAETKVLSLRRAG